MNICFVTRELSSIKGSGGIGTANEHLALALASEGYCVEVLLTRWLDEGSLLFFKNYYAAKGVNLQVFDHHFTENVEPFEARVPYMVYNYFEQSEMRYDYVLFHEYMYDGYYVLRNKATIQSLQFAKTWIVTHSPTQWCIEANKQFIDGKSDLLAFDLEKTCIENADILTSPSQYMVDWVNSRGYSLPNIVQVVQNLIVDKDEVVFSGGTIDNNISEIVFFGRLEERKGLKIFIDALNLLPLSFCEKYKITFMGNECHDNTSQVLRDRINNKFRSVKFKTHCTSTEAINYLRKANCIALMPSLVENSPCTVLECLYYGIPFLVSNSGGQLELVEDSYQGAISFSPDSKSLAKKLVCVLSSEKIVIPTAKHSPQQIFKQYLNILETFKGLHHDAKEILLDNELISIIITTYNRPKLLAQAIESARSQTYKNVEIIVVNDGDENELTNQLCKGLQSQGKIRYVCQDNKYLGAARNNGVKQAQGAYILFLDDDNFLFPNCLEHAYKALKKDNSDCVSFGLQYFYDQCNPPKESDMTNQRFIFWGGRAKNPLPLISSYFANIYGDASALYKKSVFDEVSFHEYYGVTHEDWAFHQALQMGGYKISTIPQPLLFYRVSSTSMIRTTQRYDNFRAQLGPIEESGMQNAYDLCLLVQALESSSCYKANDSKLPTVDDILSGKHDGCMDKPLLAFYKFNAKIAYKLGLISKKLRIRNFISSIILK